MLQRYAITDRRLFSRNEQEQREELVRLAKRLAADGVEFLQLREKDLDAGELTELARAMLAALHGSPTRLLLNGRADVALAAGAHGVHLTSSPKELRPEQVRLLYARAGLPTPVVTVSCHTLAEVERHRGEPVDAMLFGPVFEKVVDGERTGVQAAGIDLLRAACAAASSVPVFALGGITAENTAECALAGAAGIAAIRLFAENRQER